MTNFSSQNRKRAVLTMALLGATMLSSAAFADQVTLKSSDGTVNLVGEYVDFKDDNYIIRTALGNLRISAERVRCEGAACPDLGASATSADVTITGSDTMGLGLMPLLMTGFAGSMDANAEITNPGAGETVATLIGDGGYGDKIGSYLVSSTSDEAAFAALLEGKASVGMSSRRITPDEARALRKAGAGNMVSPSQEHIVAIDSMVVVTNPSNPVKELTMDQLRGIFSGKIRNWKDVGGSDHPINVIARDKGSTSYNYFMSYLFDNNQPDFLPGGIAKDDQQVSNVVYLDKNAIGYVGYAFQRGDKPVTLVNECGIATKPDAFSAKTEEYGLNRRMYLYNRSDKLDKESQAFLDFAQSPKADGVIDKAGFINLGILRRSQDKNDSRVIALTAAASDYNATFESGVMKDMLAEMTKYDRLSTTFRFPTGSSSVDERGRLDMQRLIGYLENVPKGTKVTFVGFTDSVGSFDGNLRLSQSRASEVLKEFQQVSAGKLDNVDFATAGYGEVAPSACNVSDRGRAINRRVEVWIAKS